MNGLERTDCAGASHFEAEATVQFLPRCPQCGHKHPKAYMPPLASSDCPVCGRTADAPGAVIEVPAVVTDRRLRLGAWLLRVGAFFHKLTKGF